VYYGGQPLLQSAHPAAGVIPAGRRLSAAGRPAGRHGAPDFRNRALKKAVPELTFVGSGYSYLQEWLSRVAAGAIGHGDADFIGYGRMVLSYPEFAADVLNGKNLRKIKFAGLSAIAPPAPRLGLVSGCFPLDEYYCGLPDYECLTCSKQQAKKG